MQRYVAAAAGKRHSVLLANDGSVVAFGRNLHGECNVPVPPDRRKYISAHAGSGPWSKSKEENFEYMRDILRSKAEENDD